MTNLWHQLRAWLRQHWIISSLFVFAALWQVFWWHFSTPIRNPWPKDEYTIKGRFPFDKGYELIFALEVVGEADWHKRVCGGFNVEKASCLAGRVFFKPQKIDGQHYEITFYRDYYFKGLQKWDAYFLDLPYEPQRMTTPEKALSGSSGWKDRPVICDDSKEFLNKFHGRLFCMRQYDDPERRDGHRKYKDLVLPPNGMVSSNVQIKNFWLESELDQMMAEQKNKPLR